MKFQSINEENIATLVRTFYPSVLQDPILAPLFIDKLGEDIEGELWEEHLLLLTEFWKFVALGYDDYKGNPLKPHLDIMGINREAFMAWLSLFHKTVDALYAPQTGEYFKNKSQEIADNFMRKLSL
ncbi:MAG TPA: group III truncated hemoglobin [Campylobacterales bacterium]|nr:group III truncated hemoglobin [Campylobacterales bacterium]